MSELKRIVDEIDQTLREIDGIKDRLTAHVVELAMFRKDMEEADAERLGRATADDRSHRTFAGNVVPLVVAAEDYAMERAHFPHAPAFETHCHCGARGYCSCKAGPPARDCPWRVQVGLAGEEIGA